MTAFEIPDDARALLGVWSDWLDAAFPLDRTMIRRFYQAVGDVNPAYWDEEVAAESRYGGIVAPPLMPSGAGLGVSHAGFEMPDGVLDPLEAQGANDSFSGIARHEADVTLLPRLNLPGTGGGVIGGFEHRLHQLPRLGDLLKRRERYVSFEQSEGERGSRLAVTSETEYRNDADELLLISFATTHYSLASA